MVNESGIVELVRGAKATVRTVQTEACSNCSANSACRAMGGSKEMLVEVDNPIGAKKGDKVEIGFDSGAFLTGSFLAYVAPVLGLLAGAMIGYRMGPWLGMGPDSAAGLGALILAVGVGWITWKAAGVLGKKEKYRPVIRRIIVAGFES